ncbi:MAG TPA: ABC transporter permease [Acidobacteriaceae bacterium]|nr:ABC transporter permease [Acidobacteriaceae bacterium]
MHTLLQDLRYALRQLIHMPGFAVAAVVSLGLGIGATVAVFSVVYAVLMDPYPYRAPDRMVHMRLTDKNGQNRYFGLTGDQWRAIRRSPVVEDVFMTDDWSLTVTGHDLPEDVQGAYVTSNTFQFLGAPPVLGRGLLPSDARDGQDPQPVAVLGYKFWQRHFSGDAAVIGRSLQLVRKNYTIVGVAAPRFTWNDADVYLPLKVTSDPVHNYQTELRLKPGVSHAAAAAALTPLIHEFARETPKHFPQVAYTFSVIGLNDDFIEQLGGTLALLFSAVALLLTIGCGNVSILLLARGAARQHELALRSAIGASPRRIVRQLLTEALLLSFTGAALGVLLAYKTIALIVALLPQYSFPHEAAIRVNLPVLLFSVGVALFTGVVFGLWPALRLSRPDVGQVMQSGSRRMAGRLGGRATNNALIAVQIALTLLMLAGAGAAIQGFLRTMHTPLGYDPHNVMSVGIPIHDGTYRTWGERAAYFDQLQKKVATTTGVTMTAISSNATPPDNGWQTHVEFLGKTLSDEQKVRVNFVSPTYFPVLRIPLVQGRIWDETESIHGAHVAVINQTMARRYFPTGDAIGHSLRVPELRDQPPYNLAAQDVAGWLQIVGIVADKLDDGLRKPIQPEVFVPYTLSMNMFTQILVRSEVSPLTLLHSVGAQVNSVDADQQINGQVQDLEHWITGQPEIQQEHLVAWLFGLFAALGLVLAAVGLYSVVSYTVAQRTNEFGIRMALGAPRTHVLRIVFESTVLSVGCGMAAGLVLTFSLQRLLAHWAEGTSRDPVVVVAAALLLSGVAIAACSVPARRASRVDPVTALRY